MTDYNDGEWHGWSGGECPVDVRSKVQVLWQNADGSLHIPSQGVAGNIAFLGNDHGRVVAFCVTKEHREPREIFCFQFGDNLFELCRPDNPAAIRFREVLE